MFIKRFLNYFTFLFVFLLILFSGHLYAQPVQVGLGSYSTTVPSGEIGPKNSSGANASPKVSPSFSLPVQTNDFWSSLIYPFFSDPHSNGMYAHPLNVKAVPNGFQLGYATNTIFPAADYLFPFSQQITVGVVGLTASQTLTDSYGDWTATALWDDGNQTMKATFGHGLPYTFFTISGGNAVITPTNTPTVWSNSDGVLGITVEGKHYGIFAPSGSSWSISSTLESSLNGQDYLSVALLPDSSPETLELFRKHAYAFVTNSLVSWEYDEASATMQTTYSYETELKEDINGNINETLSALYRHQWLYIEEAVTNYTYISPRGMMKLFEGNEFTTKLKFSGIVPSLPNQGEYNPSVLLAMVQSVAQEPLNPGPSYENGKEMGRFAQLVHIADQIGATAERDYFLSALKTRLEDWFTVGGEQEYSYNATWNVLTGYPSGFGADNQINDHHFHASYAVMSAATVAQYDSAWASQENWGGMVNLLIKDANNWDRTDTRFPFLRSHDSYAGHSWAAGHGDFGDGNNQESSSESMNFASAVTLWGANTGQQEVRDLGIFLYTNETTAIEQYWFDVDNAVFPESYPYAAIGIVWGGKGVHSTWFGGEPEYIHGINLLPITSGSLYLGRHPEHIIANFNEVVSERNGEPTLWKDVFWQYLALADADLALSKYYADANYEPFDGESKAHTLHWLTNLKKMGRVDTSITATIPTYSVFKDDAGDKTYIAYNPGSEAISVIFSDGYTMNVPAREMKTESTAIVNTDAPVTLLVVDKTKGKAPLTVNFKGSNSFDRNGSALSYLWNFGNELTSSAIDTSITFTEEGEYKVFLTVTNELELSTSDSVLITVSGNGTPFNGTAPTVPATIEAEHYDNGGEGIAYHDADANNIGQAFRPDEGVDLQPIGGGFAVYWITSGEWIEYTFQVNESGLYSFSPYVATVPGFGYFNLLIDNEDVSGRRNVTGTGGFENWVPIEINDVQLETGVHRMRFEFGSDTDKTGWLFSMNNIVIEKSTSISSENETNIPVEFTLSQNYPNPFNPSTQIEFSLPETGNVQLKIYNMVGQTVQVLIDEVRSQGSHSVSFNASDLSSGVYFYRLEFDGIVLSNKMLLMK